MASLKYRIIQEKTTQLLHSIHNSEDSKWKDLMMT
jgi:hypothetical protein